MVTESVSIKMTWEAYMYEMLRILLNPHAELTPEGRDMVVKNMIQIARMADKCVGDGDDKR